MMLLTGLIASIATGIAAAAISRAADQPITSYEIEGRKSGYMFLTPATQALQDDDFQNPGVFALERGRDLWNQPAGGEGKSCASCHGDAESSMKGVAARYPVFDAARNGLVNLELRLNSERAARMNASPFPYESDDLLALTTYISNQSRGMPMRADIDGPARPFFEEGRRFYETRRGQLDLACGQCHEERVGAQLRGDVISQGQINGFPVYRVSWRGQASRHRIFAWCNTSVRAEPYELGSPEYLSLELFLAWRGRGLPIEAPSVRR